MQSRGVGRSAQKKQRFEHELIEQADETWVTSCVEQRSLQERWLDKSIQSVSNIVDVPRSKTPFALRRGFLFIGGFQHPPNIDAVVFFVQKIYPLVSEHLRDVKFYIIGDKAPPTRATIFQRQTASLKNFRKVMAIGSSFLSPKILRFASPHNRLVSLTRIVSREQCATGR